jgi:uncharacterized protein (DUF58 family)
MNPALRQQLLEGERLGQRYLLPIPQTALSGLNGTLLGRHAGSSIDFQEHRDYQPGDDLRRIDWGIYARSDKLVVKLFREEVTPHLDLLVDGSRSMDLANTQKAEALCRLAALLAVAAENAGCTHAVWMASRGFQRLFNDHLLPSAWAGLKLEGTGSLAEDFNLLPPSLRRQGVRILISDLLCPADPLPILRRLTEGAAAVWVIQLLARSDVDPAEPGSLRLVDSESGEELDIFIDAVVEQRYRQALEQHQREWQQACRQTRARMLTLVAESLRQGQGMAPLEEAGVLQAS